MKKHMWLIGGAVVFVLAFLGLYLAGGNKTPERNIVTQKEQSIVLVEQGETGSVDIYEAPNYWQEEITYDNTVVKISVDSEITIPDIKALPIYHVDNNVPIPQNTVDAVIKKFFGTSLVYETSKPDSDEEYEFSGKGADANGYERNIWVANCDKESGTKILVYGEKSMGYVSDTAEMHTNDGTISKDEAIQQAEALLEEFGITNMQITCAEFAGRYDSVTQTNPSEYGYNISFARVANDVVCHAQNYIPKSTQSAESYSAAIENEIVTVGITKSGIWTFEWKGYFEPGEKMADNVKLMEFSDIQKAFKDGMKFCYFDAEQAGGFTEYRINSIVLGYSKTAIQNENGELMLTPIWNFYGEYLGADGKWYGIPGEPIMSINAIDGSIGS